MDKIQEFLDNHGKKGISVIENVFFNLNSSIINSESFNDHEKIKLIVESNDILDEIKKRYELKENFAPIGKEMYNIGVRNAGKQSRLSRILSGLTNAKQTVKDNVNRVGASVEKAADSISSSSGKVGKAADSINNTSKKVGRAVIVAGSAAGIALVSAAHSKFEQLVKGRCKNTSGREYKMCKIACIEQQIKFLKMHRNSCNRSATPDICKNKVNETIQKLETKKQTIFEKISK